MALRSSYAAPLPIWTCSSEHVKQPQLRREADRGSGQEAGATQPVAPQDQGQIHPGGRTARDRRTDHAVDDLPHLRQVVGEAGFGELRLLSGVPGCGVQEEVDVWIKSPMSALRKATEKIIIHHSASPRTTTVETIRRWHKDRGFDDIGYHFLIRDDGAVVKGRDVHLVGAHALGANHDSVGICLIGDNTKDDQCWTTEQIISMRSVVHSLRIIYGPIAVYGHRDAPGLQHATACPAVSVRELLMGSI